MIAPQAAPQYSALCELSQEEICQKIKPPDSEAKSRISMLIREFKAEVAYAEKHLTDSIRKSSEYLVPEEDQAQLLPQAVPFIHRYAVVDTLAIRYRNRTRFTLIGLLAIALLAMVVLEVFAHILPEHFPPGSWPRLTFLLFPLLWLGALVLWRHAHSRKYQRKYQDYRALAEGLRVQFFWHLLGLSARVEDHYLHKQQGELDWIRGAIACWRERDQQTPTPAYTPDRLETQKELVLQHWVVDQLDYFTKVRLREERQGRLCKLFGTGLFWLSLGLAVILSGYQLLPPVQTPGAAHLPLSHEESFLIVAIALLLAFAAVAVAYGEKMAFAEHARQYEAMRVLFQRYATQLVSGAVTPNDLLTLGKEALQENGDWLLLHRDRHLEVIVP